MRKESEDKPTTYIDKDKFVHKLKLTNHPMIPLIKEVKRVVSEMPNADDAMDSILGAARKAMIKLVDEQEAADVDVVESGFWIFVNNGTKNAYVCNGCTRGARTAYPYCPYCGRKMDGGLT